MKATLTLMIFLAWPWLIHAQNREDIPSLRSNTSTISYRQGNVVEGWTVMPELEPDLLTIACRHDTELIVFTSDIDSIRFSIAPGEELYFNVILNKQDTALTRVLGVPYRKAVNFGNHYIIAHKGKVSVEVPEVQELVHIIFAATRTGRQDSDLVYMTTNYYREVMKHFMPYAHHDIVAIFDSLLEIGYYTSLKMNSCAFLFDKDQLVKSANYDHLAGDHNQIDEYVAMLEDFSRISGFRAFYKGHVAFYDSLIREQQRLVPVKKMWRWLEDQFPSRYSSYKITFSPLVYGSHSTSRFEDNGFSQTFMFISGPERGRNSSDIDTVVWKGALARVLFTEIDHNYVNPETDKYLDSVNKAFADIDHWADSNASRYYPSPYSIFNEYMTWSVFTLYLYDTYPEKDLDKVNRLTEGFMVNRRGFSEYKAFNRQLLKLYKNRKDKKVADLYPGILEWCLNFKK